PAIEYAESGYPISPVLGKHWEEAFRRYEKELDGEAFSQWCSVFAPEGKVPGIGEIWSSPDHAETLKKIAESTGEA
ncbi:MAG TPA: gamma-glutamyltransferase, partial [Synergistaceae bacterium]|nr:gamma-glutamyltransferase [Synergistaceae bacterium]